MSDASSHGSLLSPLPAVYLSSITKPILWPRPRFRARASEPLAWLRGTKLRIIGPP